ncbi:Glycosyltransferase involved in cell wall bisynthesis [Filimonas lacunae]|uniref:Glycosyltransferase involved in cell wall bisynthesis n=1 Tax=Filimonas lacunae TaxID=477680 RepID=A0A173M9R8_9BACT|nr:glycosyltransferase family 2 protein [Filimonas lacunae]BAV04294.1 beta 1,4 glucosyltransferase [Filimonas lacunae]SIT30934.1 Glycosyltransferase involved in cell wall bisynthesis [Filimonas lacunae]
MVSVLILTKNEEQDIADCLKSVAWCDDVHVFDSFSDDKTLDIAQSFGAKISQRKFDGYASQRNAALTTLNYLHDWIFILDADERIPADLVSEIRQVLPVTTPGTAGFRIRRRDFLGKRWLKHAQISPFYIRLVRKGKASYHREINEVIEVEGEVKDLNYYFDHYPFSKGYAHWLHKHNQYSSMEAARWIEEHKGNFNFSWKKALLSKDFSEKRYHQKGIFYKMPFRPFIKWMYMVVARRSFLDGKEGITYATLQSIYEYFIVLKTKEQMQVENNGRV